jgi:hypothetical protein
MAENAMTNEVMQWAAIALGFLFVLPILVGLRRCSIADLETLGGASRRPEKGK